MNLSTIEQEDRLLFKYIRGSHLYGLETPESDYDWGGIFICKPEAHLGFLNYQSEISDVKHDKCYYEIGNFIRLLTKSNPTVMEALFAPKEFWKHYDPRLNELFNYKDNLLTKEIFWPFYGYAKSQIEKARGLNKKIVNPIVERKTPLDFTYTFKNQGSQPILEWLEARGLKPEFCGLNKIPHMNYMYGVYYDWGGHYQKEYSSLSDINIWFWITNKFFNAYEQHNNFCIEIPESSILENYLKQEPILHYRGLTTEEVSHTTQLRLSSIDDKNDKPICWISFNQSGFQDHCRKYKEFKEWEKNRNPIRYESNLNKTYDSKNIMHCFRLIHMAKEILSGEGFNLYRTWDREFLMNIRNHKFEYDEIIESLNKEKEELEQIYTISTLPEKINVENLNQILINIRLQDVKNSCK